MEEQRLIKNIRHSHEAIGANLRLLEDSVNAELAILSDSSIPEPELYPKLHEKQASLQTAIAYLADGIKKHMAEEDILRPYIGNALIAGMAREHGQIHKSLERLQGLTNIRIDSMGRETLLGKSHEFKEAIGKLRQQLEKHGTEEDAILALLEAAFGVGDTD